VDVVARVEPVIDDCFVFCVGVAANVGFDACVCVRFCDVGDEVPLVTLFDEKAEGKTKKSTLPRLTRRIRLAAMRTTSLRLTMFFPAVSPCTERGAMSCIMRGKGVTGP